MPGKSAFGGDFPATISIPARASKISDMLCAEDNAVTLTGNTLQIELKANFEAIAIISE